MKVSFVSAKVTFKTNYNACFTMILLGKLNNGLFSV